MGLLRVNPDARKRETGKITNEHDLSTHTYTHPPNGAYTHLRRSDGHSDAAAAQLFHECQEWHKVAQYWHRHRDNKRRRVLTRHV